MKTFIYIIVFSIISFPFKGYANTNNPNIEIETILYELIIETNTILDTYRSKNNKLYQKLKKLKIKLSNTNISKEQIQLLIKKEEVKEKLLYNSMSEASEISKVRYLKGLQIIKILYEKTLSLDHHFATVATFNEINNLSNPNNYPEFIKLKDNISSSKDKKSGFSLSGILGENIYTSVVYSIVSLFTNSNTSRLEKEENIKDVECILDFTLRMHNDLNTIYFETAFLQKSNDNVIKELEQLFVDFTKPIKYKISIKDCRNSDDWDTVRENLNKYIEELKKSIEDDSKRYKAHKMQIDLEFPIDRLLQFITLYNSHIDQGAKFYEKFGIMLGSYENEAQCATKIPLEYSNLKDNINTSIDKFNTAYKPVEINGSKMKQVLYGINEYD
ncbi:hypothetical protein [Olleya sp. YS]|uniref:hypothetical protein n=1 Tax=Olleya sp. YS TaxID=3028318 RepID=UPI002434333C|nr:hypothetical protein [Olleya sp. YS]WGD35646.1 hypothetical protein Ollyesu_04365 [Olleya sp. YS]